MNRDYAENNNRRSVKEGIPLNLVFPVLGNFRVHVRTNRPEVRGGAPKGILYCSHPWLKVIRNTGWSDPRSVMLDNTLAGIKHGESVTLVFGF